MCLTLGLFRNLVIFRVNSSLFTHFQNILRDNLGYSRVFYHHSGIFMYIQAHLESYVTVVHSGPWHIQNPEIFRSRSYVDLKGIFIIIAYSESWNIQSNGLYTTPWIVRFLLNI